MGDNDAQRKWIINMPGWHNKSIFHNLGYIPNGWIVVWSDSVWPMPIKLVSATDQYLVMLNQGATMNMKLFVF
jgi:hypothetical protein